MLEKKQVVNAINRTEPVLLLFFLVFTAIIFFTVFFLQRNVKIIELNTQEIMGERGSIAPLTHLKLRCYFVTRLYFFQMFQILRVEEDDVHLGHEEAEEVDRRAQDHAHAETRDLNLK